MYLITNANDARRDNKYCFLQLNLSSIFVPQTKNNDKATLVSQHISKHQSIPRL